MLCKINDIRSYTTWMITGMKIRFLSKTEVKYKKYHISHNGDTVWLPGLKPNGLLFLLWMKHTFIMLENFEQNLILPWIKNPTPSNINVLHFGWSEWPNAELCFRAFLCRIKYLANGYNSKCWASGMKIHTISKEVLTHATFKAKSHYYVWE